MTAPLAVALGDPAGIGPEIVGKSWTMRESHLLPPFFVVGSREGIQAVWDGPIASIADPSEAAACFAHALPLLQLGDGNSVTPGAPDVICISTFSNDTFFYFSVWLNNPEINFGKYDWILTNETGRYSMGIWPLERKGDTGRFPDGERVVNASIEVAQKQIIEGRIPLSLLGGKPVTEVNFKVFRSSAGPNDEFEFQSPTLAEVDE